MTRVRIRLFVDLDSRAFEENGPMTEFAAILRTISDQAEQDGLLGWMVIQDANSEICGELQVETRAEDKEED